MGNKFKKVSFEEYVSAWKKLYGENSVDEDVLKLVYGNIEIPSRSTAGSAGYDFYAPFGFTLHRGEALVVPTGISMQCDPETMFLILPRSGMGFKSRLMLANTIGLIDSDYQYSDNEGHIMAKIVYEGFDDNLLMTSTITGNINGELMLEGIAGESYNNKLNVKAKDRFIQGIFVKYDVIDDEDKNLATRNGGMGSTDKK